jgi:hypothetical protein
MTLAMKQLKSGQKFKIFKGSDFQAWKSQTLYFEDFFVSQMKLDLKNFHLTFVLELSEDIFEFVSITFPNQETYPKGDYNIKIEDDDFDITIEGNDAVTVLENIFDEFNRKKEKILQKKIVESEWIEEDIVLEDDKTLEKWASDIFIELQKEVAVIKKTPGWDATVEVLNQDILLKLSIDPKKRIKLTNLSGIARGLDIEKLLIISVWIPLKSRLPTIQFVQAGSIKKKLEKVDSKFGICSFLDVFAKNDKFLEKNLSQTKFKTSKFALQVLKYVEDYCLSCTQQCIICGNKLPIEGIRPTICQKQLCVYGHENLGLGIDVSYEIENRKKRNNSKRP